MPDKPKAENDNRPPETVKPSVKQPVRIDCLHCAIKAFVDLWCAARPEITSDPGFGGVIVAELAQVLGEHCLTAFPVMETRIEAVARVVTLVGKSADMTVKARGTSDGVPAVDVTGQREAPADPAHGQDCGCLRCAMATAMNTWAARNRDGALHPNEAAEALEWGLAQIIRGDREETRCDTLADIIKAIAHKSGFGAEKVAIPDDEAPSIAPSTVTRH